MAITIPKRVFFFWSGDKMSWFRYMTLFSFRKHNPDWQMDLYLCDDNKMKKTWDCPNQQDFFCYDGPDYFNKVEELGVNIIPWEVHDPAGVSWASKITPSQKSNFFKWETLAKEGGIYADMDILWTAPIDTYYNALEGHGSSICFRYQFFSIGLLASEPGCKLFEDIWKNGFSCFDNKKYQTAGVLNLYKLLSKRAKIQYSSDMHKKGWDIIKEHYPECRPHNIEAETVYPWIFNQLDHLWTNIHIHDTLPEKCIGLHWYAGAEQAQWFNQRVTEKNVHQYPCTVTNFAKDLL